MTSSELTLLDTRHGATVKRALGSHARGQSLTGSVGLAGGRGAAYLTGSGQWEIVTFSGATLAHGATTAQAVETITTWARTILTPGSAQSSIRDKTL